MSVSIRLQFGVYSRVCVRGRNWRKEGFAEESRGCGITLLESWRSNSWNQSVLSGIAISLSSQIPSNASRISARPSLKKSVATQKKPLEALGSSPPPSRSAMPFSTVT
ncbi:hypothetical protein DEO72_LG2g4821 [Vigna unguiculata]|uniref:Uncharacterized protein n=1 Tax=Vigna unguiculata TaxID=3917 RepID=A0A4D6L7G0_VIGUN|nr:hypothetical protein DEO72_LG2g4821 [Vigna unguiculata]